MEARAPLAEPEPEPEPEPPPPPPPPLRPLPTEMVESDVVPVAVSVEADILFRVLQPGDLAQVRALHEDWFPVRYEDAFYERVVNCGEQHAPYYTMAAVLGTSGEIVGLITASIATEKESEEGEILSSMTLSLSERRLAYILTLGVIPLYRRNGLARQLLEQLHLYIEAHERSCQALYLHCLSTNRPALRFYADADFEQLELKRGFYVFNDAKHDAMTLARYVNGGWRPWRLGDVKSVLWAPVNWVLRLVQGEAEAPPEAPVPRGGEGEGGTQRLLGSDSHSPAAATV